jgi:hypothetical protein
VTTGERLKEGAEDNVLVSYCPMSSSISSEACNRYLAHPSEQKHRERGDFFFLFHWSHSISFTRAQGIPKCKIGFGRERMGALIDVTPAAASYERQGVSNILHAAPTSAMNAESMSSV